MKAFFVTYIMLFLSLLKSYAQYAAQKPFITKGSDLRSVQYNAFGMGVLPHQHLMAGGNHVSYKKYGFGISWRVGVQNIISKPGKAADFPYDTALAKGWLTGKKQQYFSYSACFNFVLPITKKIPFYAGIGATRTGMYAESIEVNPLGDKKDPTWHLVQNEVKFKLNITAGTYIPITNRIALNIAYDHLPQTMFIGIAIGHPLNYVDIDLW
ncbi:MAG: hypothetical protein ACK4K9_09340 [Bacteroidia bacterium]